MNIKENDYDFIVTPFPEKFAKILHLPYTVTWFLFSCLLVSAHIFAIKKSGEPISPLWIITVVGFLPALIAISIIWFSKMLEKFTSSMFIFIDWPKEQVIEWYASELKAIFNIRWMSLCGILMTALLLPTAKMWPLWTTHTVSRVTIIILITVLTFLAGGILYTMMRIAVMVYKLGRIDQIKVSVYQHPLTSIKAVGVLLGKIATTITIIYIFGISYHICCKTNLLLLFLSLALGIIVISFFIVPQIEVHKIMAKVKHKRLTDFSAHLEDALISVTKNPSTENVQRVRELFEVQQSLNEMGEWPFDTKLFLTIVTGIAVPIVAVLLQMLPELIKGFRNLWQ